MRTFSYKLRQFLFADQSYLNLLEFIENSTEPAETFEKVLVADAETES